MGFPLKKKNIIKNIPIKNLTPYTRSQKKRLAPVDPALLTGSRLIWPQFYTAIPGSIGLFN